MINDKHVNSKNEGYYRRNRSWTQYFDIKRDSKILDVGCGHGLLGKYLNDTLGAQVTGIEIVKSCYYAAKEKLHEVILGDIETMDLAMLDKDYDYVIFSDSLEHLINPDIALLKVLSLLKKDGNLLISIPNVQNFRITLPLLLKGSWEYTEDGLMDRTHLRWFTETSITSLVEQNGFQLQQLERELPLSSKSGKLNLVTFSLLQNHLTSHFYLKACLADS